jgi:ParB family chromosome partitioning protein
MSKPPNKLGRGLAALIGDAAAPPAPEGTATIPLDQLSSSPYQPRRHFDETAMAELAESIRARGVLQPLLVRPRPGGYEIIAGERRWRAAQMAGLHDIPVLVRALSDDEAAAAAIIENVQRTDLNPVEEAEGYRRLSADFGLTQEAIAGATGKSRSHIANAVRLLTLPEPVLAMLREGKLTAGHARTLVGHPDAAERAQRLAERGMTVRQAENLATPRQGIRRKPARDADIEALESRLAEALGLRVAIAHGSKGGTLTIRYRDLDQLDMVIAKLSD